MVFAAHTAETPGGKPIADPIPVAPTVVCVIVGNTELTQIIGALEADETVLSAITVMVPEVLTELHPPVNGIV
jgi:hypothetical protein